MKKNISPLIAAEDVSQYLSDSHTIIMDVRTGADAKGNYTAQHIQGAIYADLNKDLALIPEDAANGGRHPLPSPSAFAAFLGKCGITPQTNVLVYDDKQGSNAAARLWWMLRAAGHEKVAMIDGGLQEAIKAGVPITDQPSPIHPTSDYPFQSWQLPVVTADEVATATDDPRSVVIDVRDAYRYRGESEPIDTVAGHIPGAINIPYATNLDKNGRYLPADKLADIYLEVSKKNNIIVHCGSGVTACHTLLALQVAGIEGAKLYVGSWSEWSRNNRPQAKEV
ncbi:sulfurtransferase [Chitinophaga pendula]|uniref:sulfurtransferase n=1 Tax=Chitinophaga TaxID=79328 RepID=UPI000BB08E99|nr:MULTISPECIES: sulfurtransferase [Chitinophaga]ASZ13126.1 sulfurtransferase [Chitinophaga sp. MD30]UCJ09248.1 sulfurtransferase [Chitinophaga pendula]